jgi:hypothetical protein
VRRIFLTNLRWILQWKHSRVHSVPWHRSARGRVRCVAVSTHCGSSPSHAHAPKRAHTQHLCAAAAYCDQAEPVEMSIAEKFQLKFSYILLVCFTVVILFTSLLQNFIPTLWIGVATCISSVFLGFSLFKCETEKQMDEKSILLESSDQIAQSGVSISFWKAVQTYDFYAVAFVFLAVIGTRVFFVFLVFAFSLSLEGSGSVVVSNIAWVVYALADFENGATVALADMPYVNDIPTLVTLFSVSSSVRTHSHARAHTHTRKLTALQTGRLIVGFLCDGWDKKPLFLGFYAIAMTLVMQLFNVASIYAVFVGIVLCGLTYGGTFVLLPAIYLETFGGASFGAIWGIAGLAPAISTSKFTPAHAHAHTCTACALCSRIRQ